MKAIQRVLGEIKNVVEVLVGEKAFHPLPESFHQQTDWQRVTEGLGLPAVWRRKQC